MRKGTEKKICGRKEGGKEEEEQQSDTCFSIEKEGNPTPERHKDVAMCEIF